jgi:hypothetical protein
MFSSVRRARRGSVVLVGRESTPAWQVLRVLVVCLLTLGTMHALRRPSWRAAPGRVVRFPGVTVLDEEPKR